MAKANTTTETATEPNAESTASSSSNLTLDQLSKRMTKGRKAPAATKTAKATGTTTEAATTSEHTDAAETETVLSKSAETDDSPALESEPSEEVTETTEPEEAPAEEAEGEKGPKAVRDLQKRVGKVTEQRNDAREEAAEWRRRAEEAESRLKARGERGAEPEPHRGERSFAREDGIVDIDKQLAGIRNFVRWADENSMGGSFTEDGKEFHLNADEVKNYRLQCDEQRIRLSAKREARMESLRLSFDAQANKAHAEAIKLYPWLTDKSSPEFQEAVQILRQHPELTQRPDYEAVVARQVMGLRLENEAKKKAGIKTTRQEPPRVVTQSSSTAPRKSPEQAAADTSAAENQFKQTGSVRDLSKLLAQRRQSRLGANA